MGRDKSKAHELAVKWWKSSGRSSAECDMCSMTTIGKGEGYLCDPSASQGNVLDMLSMLGHSAADVASLGLPLGSSPDLICESCFDSSPTASPAKG
jgi:hypothetical protein